MISNHILNYYGAIAQARSTFMPDLSSVVYIPLTHAEKRIYFTQKLHPGSSMWNVPASLRLAGADAGLLSQAVRYVAANAPGLQVRFTEQDGQPVKCMAPAAEPPEEYVEHLDFSEQGEDAYWAWAEEQATQPLPMLDARPYCLAVADAGGGTAFFFANYHHIAADGGASDTVFHWVTRSYEALRQGQDPEPIPLVDPALAYKAEQEYLDSGQRAEDEKYWNVLFESIPEPMDIAGKPATGSLALDHVSRRFGPDTTRLLLAWCAENRVSPFRVVLAAMGAVLFRTLRREDVVLGTATANRHPAKLRDAVGMFVSTCAMRMQVEPDLTFQQLVDKASHTVRQTVAHERYPYDMLTANLRQRTGEAPDLIAATLVEVVRAPLPDYAEVRLHSHGESLISLACFLTYPRRNPQGQGSGVTAPSSCPVEMFFTYNAKMFEPWRVEQLAKHVENAVRRGVEAPDTPVKMLDFLGGHERSRLVETFNATGADWDYETTMHACIETAAKRYPGRNAVVYRGKSLTYADLDAKANALARKLRDMGAAPGKVVGLLADRSLEIVVGQLAILKSGAGFMPIDAEYPDSRIAYMLSDVQADIVVTQTRFMQGDRFGKAAVVNLDDADIFQGDRSPVDSGAAPHDLCAVIYTSGSTGKPKGVLLEHWSLCNVIMAAIRDCAITQDDKLSKHASFSFDASMLEVFSALAAGAELHIIPEDIKLSLSHLNEYYESKGVTWAFLTTQLGEQFMNFIDNRCLRILMVGGEKLRTFTPRNYQLKNIYGPTECSIYATAYDVDRMYDNIPIGPPVANYRIYILDQWDNPQPAGFGGEICVAGPGVGRGYHNLPEKTAACFTPDPFHAGETMYRTGDLGCWTPEGTVLHLGRMDRQVKLRGFRIELGEIENAMLAMEGVTEAAVSDFLDSSGRVFLCGYYCGNVDLDRLREHLKARVPEFMVPAHMLQLDAMPVNPSGKIDRKQLPRPEEEAQASGEFVQPEGELETALAAAWAKVLDVMQVSAEADFFRSGGDSLRAVSLQLTLSKELDKDVELSAIFEYPSPRAMARYLEGAAGAVRQAIPKAARADYYPATVAQQQLYLLSRMEGLGTAYNMPMVLELGGDVDEKKLSGCLLAMVDRHESLRTAFTVQEGKCVQQAQDNVHLKLDFTTVTEPDPAPAIRGFVRPFDLAQPPLMRALLVAHTDPKGEVKRWLLLDFHHIAFDGVSVGVFLRELAALYAGEALEAQHIQHKDFAAWEAAHTDEAVQAHEDFWLDLFASPPEVELPTDHPRPAGASFAGDVYRHLLDHSVSDSLVRLARSQGATLHQVFMAGLAVLLGRWADAEDLCLGTSMSGRDRPGTTELVGMFVRTLPARLQPAADKTFAALLQETSKQMLSMHEHGEYPVSRLYEKLGVNRGPGRHPLFDVNFVMRNIGMATSLQSAGMTVEVSFIPTGTAKFDLSFAAEQHELGLALEVDYRTAIYGRDTVARMVSQLERILLAVAANPEQPLAEIDIIGPEERDTLLRGFNPQPTEAPWWPTACQAITRHAQKRPDHTAVQAEDGTLTYAELEALANRAARAIQAAGAKPDSIVAVTADRSKWAAVGMLAALKAGAAFVGLDVHYPPERKQFILEDTKAPCVVGSTERLAEVEFDGPKIALDGDLPQDATDPDLARGGSDLAYCIFTSGSTGKPKGVLIEHHSMVNFINWYAAHHEMTPDSHCAAFASFSFDVSVVQVFAPLVSGAVLHVVPEDLRRDPQKLDEYFRSNSVTHVHFPTQFAEQFMRLCEGESLTHMVVGGDRLRSYRLESFRLANEYGPSETAMACLSYDVDEVEQQPPVGSPVANTRIYILDSRGRLCPLGAPGEICVAGTGVGRGYLNRGDLTAEKFVQDPFVVGGRMFRTGDKGRWLHEGMVDFIGRMDFQVKIRGYRVEPGEIEARISGTGRVQECVVVPLEEPSGKVLAAYCTAAGELDVDALRSTLKAGLPEYMVPAHIIQLDNMPLNPNGKIDRKKLPRPELGPAQAGPLEPRNDKEARIAAAWGKVLGHRGYGLFDSFYDVGGDSLSAISLLAELSESFDVSASDIFAHTTIADQAAAFPEAEVGRSARLLRLKGLATPPALDPALAAQEEVYAAKRKADRDLDATTTTDLEHVLLTGATGTLGIYLLRELLDDTEARITALVRGKDEHAVLDRLAKHYYGRFGRDLITDASDRLYVLPGDLAKPDLGLPQDVYDHAEATVDAILHSAALTSHYGDWSAFQSANVDSVANLAAFARKGRSKAMHHISTTSIGAGSVPGRSQVLFTEFDVDLGQESGNLYVRSKLEAEKLLEKAREEGLTVNVYRAGNITCDSETGEFQRNVDDNAFYQQLRAYVNLGKAPDGLDVRNMTFVDQAAKTIVLLMRRPGLANQTFHIHNPHLLSLSQALSDVALGLRVDKVPFEEFIEFFAAHAGKTGFDEYVERILLHLGWQDWLADPAATKAAIRVERSADLLQRAGFAWKVPEPEDLRRFVLHALEDRVEPLQSVPGFAALDKETLLALAARLRPEYFPDDRLLQTEKQPVDGVRFVMDGMVETYRHNYNGWVGTVRVGGPGSVTGEEAIPGGDEQMAAYNSVEALEDVFAFQADPADMRRLIMAHPALGLAMLRLAAVRANQAETLFVAL